MDIFCSWSGKLSNDLAIAFKDWLRLIYYNIDIFVSSEDIHKGDRWSFIIADELNQSTLGIVFITRENYNSPWINFEVGAISKKIGESKLAPLLFGLSPTEIEGPICQFQCTQFNKKDFKKLFRSITSTLIKNISDKITDDQYERYWPELEAKVNNIVDLYIGLSSKPLINTYETYTSEYFAHKDIQNTIPKSKEIKLLLIRGSKIFSPKNGLFNLLSYLQNNTLLQNSLSFKVLMLDQTNLEPSEYEILKNKLNLKWGNLEESKLRFEETLTYLDEISNYFRIHVKLYDYNFLPEKKIYLFEDEVYFTSYHKLGLALEHQQYYMFKINGQSNPMYTMFESIFNLLWDKSVTHIN